MQMSELLSGWCFWSCGLVAAEEWMHKLGSEVSVKHWGQSSGVENQNGADRSQYMNGEHDGWAQFWAADPT